MKAQRLFSYVRRATDDYNMINDGDKIAVGISGGKDSLTLLYALNGLSCSNYSRLGLRHSGLFKNRKILQ